MGGVCVCVVARESPFPDYRCNPGTATALRGTTFRASVQVCTGFEYMQRFSAVLKSVHCASCVSLLALDFAVLVPYPLSLALLQASLTSLHWPGGLVASSACVIVTRLRLLLGSVPILPPAFVASWSAFSFRWLRQRFLSKISRLCRMDLSAARLFRNKTPLQ